MPIWRSIFRLGLGAGTIVLLLAFTIALGQILNAQSWPVEEGDSFARFGGGAAMWIFVLSGFALLVPSFAHLYRSQDQQSANRVGWTVALVLFPFVAPYFYFGLKLKAQHSN